MTKHGVDGRLSRRPSSQEAASIVRALNQEPVLGDPAQLPRLRAPRQLNRPSPLGSLVRDTEPKDEDNQHSAEAGFSMEHISLELLAMLSPHGTTQQWDDEDIPKDDDKSTKDLHEVEREEPEAQYYEPNRTIHSRGLGQALSHLMAASGRRHPDFDLTSPTDHIQPFVASPAHSDSGEVDLASPVSLGEVQDRRESMEEDPRIHSAAGHTQDDDPSGGLVAASPHAHDDNGATNQHGPPTMSRQNLRVPKRSPQPHARTPGRQTILAESRSKPRHGGIYSLLLKNRPPEQEPTLVEDLMSPRGPEASPSTFSSMTSPPPSMGKPQHGGIYALLRQNSKN